VLFAVRCKVDKRIGGGRGVLAPLVSLALVRPAGLALAARRSEALADRISVADGAVPDVLGALI
jgi:hypothetical protein